MKNKQELVNRIIDFYLTGHNLKEDEAKAVISLKEEYKAINYTRCCTELKVIEELKDLAYEVCPLHRTDDLDDIIERL